MGKVGKVISEDPTYIARLFMVTDRRRQWQEKKRETKKKEHGK
jgi:hypothetical protein